MVSTSTAAIKMIIMTRRSWDISQDNSRVDLLAEVVVAVVIVLDNSDLLRLLLITTCTADCR